MASYQDQLNSTTLPTQMAKALKQNYGLSDSDTQGLTYGDLLSLGLNTAPETTTTTSNNYSGSQGNQAQTSISTGGKQQQNNAALLKVIGKLSLGQKQQQQQSTPQGSTVSDMLQAHPEYGLSALGAAASTAAGMPEQMIINPTPSGTPSSKSGVGTVGGVQASSDIAKARVANWDDVAQQAGLSQRDVSAFIQQGLTPSDIAKRFNVSGGTTGVATPTQPGIFSAAEMPQATAARQTTSAATAPANAATYSPMATPFAQAPAAPGLDLAAHTAGLESAGRALYAHFGGDPNTATHADIANFHDQIRAGMGGGGAAGSGGFPPQSGSTSEPIAQPVKKMASGGMVTKDDQQSKDDRQAALVASLPSWLQQGQRMPQNWGPGPGPPTGMPPTPPQLVPGQMPSLPPGQGGVPPPPGLTGNQQISPELIASLPSWLQQGQRMPQNWGPGPGPPTSMPPTPPQLVPGQMPGLPPEQRGVPPPPGIKQMTTGGYVPGRGNRDTVPALLTPGEYVIPKEQVQQLMGRTPVRMQSGGFVQEDDDQPRRKLPPETRRRMLTTQSGSSTPAAQSSQSSQPASSYDQSSSPPAAPGGGFNADQIQQLANLRARMTMGHNAALSANTPAWSGATTPAAREYAAAANAGQVGGAAPTAAELQGASAMTPGQIQGSVAKANIPAAGAASAIGGLASGLASAAKAYADSVKSWQIQPDETQMFAKNVIPAAPAAQFQQYA